MGRFETNDAPKTFREIARMPERMKGDEIVLGDSFLFDPFIVAKQLKEQREARAERAKMREVELLLEPESLPEIPVQVQAEVDHFSDVA
ncbi:MAG: hypothetical protein JWO41_678 [Candidatus Saccharibacteria bacterium]|nr:hypothetical protein [Candidatus Saccharibacteria bacterium]